MIRQMPAPREKYTFIHRDYHPNNVLFENGKLVGVVDWVNACMGPVGVDVGHCCWNLAMMYGTNSADYFLGLYRAYHPHFTYNEYWDIVALMDVLTDPIEVYEGWKHFGLIDITEDGLKEKMDTYMCSIWNKLGHHHT